MLLKKHFATITLTIGFTALINTVVFGRTEKDKPVHLDPAQPINNRIEDLLARMTLKEKVGQMNFGYVSGQAENIEFIKGASRGIGPGGGFFGSLYTLNKPTTYEQVKILNEFKKTAIEDTRLGIPLTIIEEGIHGIRIPGATIFPEGPALGSTWNMDLVGEVYSAVAREARAIGIYQLCSFAIEVNRDPRLGRGQHTYSEDTYLCSQIAKAIVEAVQGRDISDDDKTVAILTVFPGQGQPVGGLDQGAMEISERTLREIFLPPWEVGIKAGALGVMAGYPAIDAAPVHSSRELLTKVLRGELGFAGCVFGEGGGIGNLLRQQTVATHKEAARLAINAGVDISIWFEPAFLEPLIENVEEGKVSIETIDTSVRRILKVKFLQGLFENPYADPNRAIEIVHSRQHQELALRAAREGIVLLKNQNNLLPLDKNIKSIAVIGPNANNVRNQLGDYLPKTIPQDIVTVLDGIKNKLSPKVKVTYVKGCDITGSDVNEIPKAQDVVRKADVAIVVVGERAREDPNGKVVGTVGEQCDVASLDLTGLQEDLVKAVVECGTPTIVVLINGRPLSIRWIAENVPAIVEAWICGEQGGNAVADVLFGDYNPAGRLPVTFPRHVGQLPVYYNYKPPRHSYVDISSKPLFEFGYGLSYTKFEYSNLQITPKPPAKEFNIASEVLITLDVENVGDRKGDEVVQLYIDDCLSSVVTPVKELKGFERITLNPVQKQTMEFILTPYQLSLLDRNLGRVVEPGTFEVMVGSSSEDIRLRGGFEVKD